MPITADIEPRDIISASDFTLSGYKSWGVRAKFGNKEGGFCATSYSFSMTDDAKEYAAKRIALLLTMAQGLTNEQLTQMVLSKKQRSNSEGVADSKEQALILRGDHE